MTKAQRALLTRMPEGGLPMELRKYDIVAARSLATVGLVEHLDWRTARRTPAGDAAVRSGWASEYDPTRPQCCAEASGKECDRHAVMRLDQQLADTHARLDAIRVAAQALVDALDALSPGFYDAEIGARARALEAALRAVGS